MDQKDPSGEEADFVRVIVQESTSMAMTAREVERESEKILNCVVLDTTYKVVTGVNAKCLITWVWRMNFAQ